MKVIPHPLRLSIPKYSHIAFEYTASPNCLLLCSGQANGAVSQWRNSPCFMEPEGSLPSSQDDATSPCPEPHESSSRAKSLSLRYFLILLTHLRLRTVRGVFPLRFQTTVFYEFFISPLRAACAAHLMRLDFITLIMFGEGYRL